MQNNIFFLSKSCYESNYIAIDQNKINFILATTDNYKFSHKHIKPTHTGNLLKVSVKRRLRIADCRLQTADQGLNADGV